MDLALEDIMQLLNILVYDDKLEAVPTFKVAKMLQDRASVPAPKFASAASSPAAAAAAAAVGSVLGKRRLEAATPAVAAAAVEIIDGDDPSEVVYYRVARPIVSPEAYAQIPCATCPVACLVEDAVTC